MNNVVDSRVDDVVLNDQRAFLGCFCFWSLVGWLVFCWWWMGEVGFCWLLMWVWIFFLNHPSWTTNLTPPSFFFFFIIHSLFPPIAYNSISFLAPDSVITQTRPEVPSEEHQRQWRGSEEGRRRRRKRRRRRNKTSIHRCCFVATLPIQFTKSCEVAYSHGFLLDCFIRWESDWDFMIFDWPNHAGAKKSNKPGRATTSILFSLKAYCLSLWRFSIDP